MSGGVEPFVVAAAIGLLLGFERERHAWVEHEESPPMGTRTFALLGLGGALAGSMSTAVVAVGLVVVGAMVVAGYWRTSSVHRGTTTEIAAVVAYLLGAYCQRDVVVAAGIGVAVALLHCAISQWRSSCCRCCPIARSTTGVSSTRTNCGGWWSSSPASAGWATWAPACSARVVAWW
jgi:hypothetical protein